MLIDTTATVKRDWKTRQVELLSLCSYFNLFLSAAVLKHPNKNSLGEERFILFIAPEWMWFLVAAGAYLAVRKQREGNGKKGHPQSLSHSSSKALPPKASIIFPTAPPLETCSNTWVYGGQSTCKPLWSLGCARGTVLSPQLLSLFNPTDSFKEGPSLTNVLLTSSRRLHYVISLLHLLSFFVNIHHLVSLGGNCINQKSVYLYTHIYW